VKLQFRNLNLQLTHPWQIARTSGTNSVQTVVVELTDVSGMRGLGEAAPVGRYRESTETVLAFLHKVNPDRLSFADLEGSANHLDSISAGDMSAKCAVNVAMLDGGARQAGKAAGELLGLDFKENQHVTSFTIGIDKPEVIRAKVLAAEAFPVLKMKVGVPEDKLNLRALREAAPGKPVRVDANEGWRTKEQALEMIEWLAEDGNIQFVEQPMPAIAPVKDWAWLKQRSPLPIYGDESHHHASDVERAAECFHGINVKLVKTGGLVSAFAALQAARRLGLKTMIGCMIESSLLVSAAAHLAGLCDYLDLDGNLLITNDPFAGVTAENGLLSFAGASERLGLRVSARQ
jgi:L-alanine-DL-glutamate epimerase-like enolase superfamily enzyme